MAITAAFGTSSRSNSSRGVYERIGRDIKRVHAALERLKCGHKIFGTPNFEDGSIEAEGARCRVNFGHVQHASGIVTIPHDRQSAQAGYSLAQDLETFGGKICPLARYPGDVRARSRQTGNKASGNRVARQCEDDRNTVCRLLCRRAHWVPYVIIKSTFSWTNSAASSSARSFLPSAQRYSIATVCPSIQPSSRSRCTKTTTHWLAIEGVVEPRKPMVGSFPGCRATAVSGHAAAAPPSSVMNSRRLIIRSPRRRGRVARAAP